jgi:hypothetical protein
VNKNGDEVKLNDLNFSIAIENADDIDHLYAVWVPKVSYITRFRLPLYSMAKSIWTMVRVLVAIVGALFLCLSGVLDILKIQGHYPAKALLMEDYAPPSPATTVTHTVTITRPASTSIPFQFATQAALEFPAIIPAAFPSESLPTEQRTPYPRTTVQREN